MVFMGGCATMALPPELNQSLLQVETSGGLFSEREYHFENWSVSDLSRGSIEHKILEHGGSWFTHYELTRGQAYDFTLLQDGVGKHRVECFTSFKQTQHSAALLGELSQEAFLACAMLAPTNARIEGRIHATMETQGMSGTASMDAERLKIHAEFMSTGSSISLSPSALGYVIYRLGEPVAAISLTHDRFIWMQETLPPALKSRVAALLMALAYYQKIEPID